MKPDERELLTKALFWHGNRNRPFMDAVGDALGMGGNRVHYLLDKWIDKGWWECGVSARTGWLTEKGLVEAERIFKEGVGRAITQGQQ